MVRQKQVVEAQWYMQHNGDLAAQVRQGLLYRMATYADHHLAEFAPGIGQRIQDKLAQGELEDAFVLLRGQACRVTATTPGLEFWDLIDAVSFYCDAAGAYWPYMTQAVRQQSLTWSLEFLLKTATLAH